MADQDNITYDYLQDYLKEYNQCESLLTESLYIKNPRFFTYKYNIPDTEFLDIGDKNSNAIIHNPLKWYLTINPTFLNMNQLIDVSFTIFKPLIQQIIRNLLLLLNDSKLQENITPEQKKLFQLKLNKKKNLREIFPEIYAGENLNRDVESINYQNIRSELFKPKGDISNSFTNNKNINVSEIVNVKIIYKILQQIEKTITRQFKYIDVMTCYEQYTRFISYNDLTTTGTCEDYYILLKQTYNTPFLIFPSFSPPNHYKTLLLLCAPIINIMCSYRIEIIHDEHYFTPCMQLYHDLDVHGNITHRVEYYVKNPSLFSNLNSLYNKWEIQIRVLQTLKFQI